MRALGVDLGTRRIGVAVSSGSIATPYEVVTRTGDRTADHRALAALVDETGAEVVVVGLPLSLDGTVGRAAQQALDEADELRAAVDVPVEVWDERLTTVTAERALMEQKMKAQARRRVVDKVAAAVLLQAWIDARAGRTPADDPTTPTGRPT